MTIRSLRPHRLVWLPLVALVLALAPAGFGATPAAAGPTAGEARGKGDGKRAKIRQRIRALRAWMLTESLDLDEDTAAKLFPVINKYDEELEKVLGLGRTLREQLEQAVDADEEATIDGLIDQMVAHQQKLWDLQDKRFAAVRKVLTAKQAARILVVLPEIDRRIQNQIRKAAGRRPLREGAPPPPPPAGADGAGDGDDGDLMNPFDRKGKKKGKGRKPAPADGDLVNPFR